MYDSTIPKKETLSSLPRSLEITLFEYCFQESKTEESTLLSNSCFQGQLVP
jgi:hypothetical protein